MLGPKIINIAQLPPKIILNSKVVKINPKIIIFVKKEEKWAKSTFWAS